MNALIIGDTQFPGHLDGYLDFIIREANRWSIDKMFHVGDLADFHYISRHPTETCALNPDQELDLAIEELSRWTKVFPDVSLCIGNHDEIPLKRAAESGMSDRFVRGINELLELPDTWVWQEQWVLNKGTMYQTVIEHGMGSNGMYAAKNTALKYMCNYIQGHTHSYGGVSWLDGPFRSIYGMQVGCGMDKDKYWAKYAKNKYKHAMAIGCGIVLGIDTPDPTPIFRRMHIE